MTPVTMTDREMTRCALHLLCAPGGVFELRVPKAGRSKTISGYFNDLDRLADAAAQLSGHHLGIYLTLNPVNPALLARAHNRVKAYAEATTADTDIVCRRWLPLDFDPVRPAGISATDAEKALARERARACRDWLRGRGWPAPLVQDSGNGYHLLYRLPDLPNDEPTRGLVERVLQAVALQFDDETVRVDTTVGNAARIWKLAGTLSAKGDATPDRPHRLARLLDEAQL